MKAPLDDIQFIQRLRVIRGIRPDGYVKSKNYWRCQPACQHRFCNAARFARAFVPTAEPPDYGSVDIGQLVTKAQLKWMKRRRSAITYFDYSVHKLVTVDYTGKIISRS